MSSKIPSEPDAIEALVSRTRSSPGRWDPATTGILKNRLLTTHAQRPEGPQTVWDHCWRGTVSSFLGGISGLSAAFSNTGSPGRMVWIRPVTSCLSHCTACWGEWVLAPQSELPNVFRFSLQSSVRLTRAKRLRERSGRLWMIAVGSVAQKS